MAQPPWHRTGVQARHEGPVYVQREKGEMRCHNRCFCGVHLIWIIDRTDYPLIGAMRQFTYFC